MSVASEPSPAIAGLIAGSGLDATGLDGAPATDREYLVEVEHTVAIYGQTLARLHGTQVDPGDAASRCTPESLVAAAQDSLAAGLLTQASLSDPYRHMAPARLVELLEQGCPEDPSEWVLTHGRPELDRLRCNAGAALGFLGWEHAALADPYRDLAIAAREVATRLSPMLVAPLLDAYLGARGITTRPDPVRLDWYALAAELQR